MGKAPSAPNPTTTIQQQTASNKETAVSQAGLNMVNQTDAMGNKLEYTQIGQWADGTPRYASTQTLSGTGQQLFNTGVKTQQNLANLAQEQSGRLSGLLNQNIDLSGLPQGGQWTNNDYSADRQRVESAMFDRLNPQIDQQRQAFETSLVNRGIRPGSAAYDQQMGQFNQGVNDQRTSILLNAGQEQSRLQNMDLAGFNAQNTQRQNALQELIMQRQMPLNEILALSGGSQLQSPQFGSTPQTGVAGTDVGGITNSAFNASMQNYNANQSLLGGLFKAGAATIPQLSDRRAKADVTRIGKTANGLPWYEFRYVTDPEGSPIREGLMAQDLLEIVPEAVTMGSDGYYRVDYERALSW